MKKFMLVVAAAFAVALAVQASPAAAATGLFRTGAFAEMPAAPPYPTDNQERIAVNFDTGDVYVVDRRGGQVSVYRQNGGSADLLTSFGGGNLDNPVGVAIDQDNGSVYVSDADGVTKYDSDNATTPTFTVDGSFAAIAATGPLAFDQSAEALLVADTSANIVRRYSAAGVAGPTFDGAGSPNTFGMGSTFTLLQDLAVDSTGDVIVIDANSDPGNGGTSRIERFSAAGVWEATIGPVDQAATVGVIPADDNVLIGGNQDAVNANESPTVRRFAPDGTDVGSIELDESVIYGTTSGIAADDGPTGRIHIGTDVSDGIAGYYGRTSVQNYDLLDLPTVAAMAATGVSPVGATLNGRVNPEGAETTYRFEYSADGGSSWTPVDPDGDGDESAGDGAADVDVSVALTDLAEYTEYRFRLVAYRGFASAVSDAQAFTTTGFADGITTSPASGVTATAATVSGSVNPQGVAVTYQVEYRRKGDTRYAKRPQAPVDLGAGTTAQPFSVELTGLRPNTDYEWRVVVTVIDSARTLEVNGPAFRTDLSAPRADTTAASSVTTGSARLNGVVDGYGQRIEYHFEHGPSDAYGTATAVRSHTGAKAIHVFADLTGLTPGQRVHYRLVATSSSGTTRGADHTVEVPGAVRAYERVTPAEKNGSDPLALVSPMAGATGGRFAYVTSAAYGTETASVTATTGYLSSRGPTAWDTKGVGLPFDNSRGLLQAGYRDISDDMQHGYGMSNKALAPGAVDGQYNYYVTDLRTGQNRLVASSANEEAYYDFMRDELPLVTGTSDYEQILLFSKAPLLPGLDPLDVGSNSKYVYHVGPDGLRIASVDDEGHQITNQVTVAQTSLNRNRVRHSMSVDGRRIFFTGASVNGKSGVWMWTREDGDRSVLISASRRPGEEHLMLGSEFLDASADGSVVFFTTTGPLLPDSEDPGREGALRVYRYQADTDDLSEIYVAPAGSQARERIIVAGVSDDGERLSFSRYEPSSLVGDVYVWEDGRGITRIGRTLSDQQQTSVDPELSTLAIQTPYGLVPTDDCAFDAGDRRCDDVYAYDVEGARLSCLTCDAANQIVGRSLIGGGGNPFRQAGYDSPVFAMTGQHYPRAVDAQGGVYVDTQKQLVSEDNDSAFDVYYVRKGDVELLTPGTKTDSVFADASVDGEDVYFSTGDRLVGADMDDNRDYYTARMGGGLASQRAGDARPPCTVDACQGPVSMTAPAPPAASIIFQGAANGGAQKRTAAATAPKVTGSRLIRGPKATIKVRLPAAGRIAISGPGLRAGSKTIGKAGTYTITVSLTPGRARALAKTGRASVKARVSFTPRTGAGRATSITLTFRRATKVRPGSRSTKRATAFSPARATGR